MTPNLNELVAAGVHLTRHYVHQYCTPTRTSVQSGRLPVHVSTGLGSPCDDSTGISQNMTGFAERLKEAGYTTAFAGVCVHARARVRVCVSVCLCVCVSVCLCVCLSVSLSLCLSVSLSLWSLWSLCLSYSLCFSVSLEAHHHLRLARLQANGTRGWRLPRTPRTVRLTGNFSLATRFPIQL